jgi:hypothetical protein
MSVDTPTRTRGTPTRSETTTVSKTAPTSTHSLSPPTLSTSQSLNATVSQTVVLPLPLSPPQPVEANPLSNVATVATVQASVTAGLVSPVTALGVQRMALFANMDGCGAGAPTGPLPAMDNPTRVSVASFGALEHYAGSVVMNVTIVLLVGGVMVAVSMFYKKLANGRPTMKAVPTLGVALRRCRAFHLTYFALVILAQPIAASSAMILFFGDGGQIAFGLLFLLLIVAIVGALWFLVLRMGFSADWVPIDEATAIADAAAKEDPILAPGLAERVLRTLTAPKGEWINASALASTATKDAAGGASWSARVHARIKRFFTQHVDDFVRTFDILFDEYREPYQSFAVVELSTSALLGFLFALSFRVPCHIGLPLIFAVAVLYVALLLWLRPNNLWVDFGWTLIFGLLQLVAATVTVTSVWINGDGGDDPADLAVARDIIDGVMTAMSVLAFLRGFWDVIKFVFRLKCRPSGSEKRRHQAMRSHRDRQTVIHRSLDAHGTHLDARLLLTEEEAQEVMGISAMRPETAAAAVVAASTATVDRQPPEALLGQDHAQSHPVATRAQHATSRRKSISPLTTPQSLPTRAPAVPPPVRRYRDEDLAFLDDMLDCYGADTGADKHVAAAAAQGNGGRHGQRFGILLEPSDGHEPPASLLMTVSRADFCASPRAREDSSPTAVPRVQSIDLEALLGPPAVRGYGEGLYESSASTTDAAMTAVQIDLDESLIRDLL